MNAHTTTKRFRRAALAAVATLSGAALLIGGTATAGAQEPETDDAPHISVAFTPAAEQGNCVPAGLGLSYVVFSDDSVFRLTVNAASPQCTGDVRLAAASLACSTVSASAWDITSISACSSRLRRSRHRIRRSSRASDCDFSTCVASHAPRCSASHTER